MIFRRDPCGIVCLFMTYGAVLYADYVVVRWVVLHTMGGSLWAAFHVFTFNVIVLLLLMSHTRAVISDPGIVPLPHHRIDFSDAQGPKEQSGTNSEDYNEDWTICTRCEMYRPPRAHHCRICQRCIRKMDHHCPWINNCVGEWNQKYFLQFLFYVGILSLYALSLVIISWYTKCPDCPKDIHIRQRRVMHCILLVLESILFGMFVVAIGCDQFEAVFTDETLVEQVKVKANNRRNTYRPRKPKMALMAEVFGRGHPALWLLPCRSGPSNIEPASHYEV